MAVISAIVVMPAQAAQAASPRLTHVHLDTSRVTARGSFVVYFRAFNVPDGGKVLVQRQFGSRRIWKDVAFPASNETAVLLTAPTRGRYTYQVVISKDHKTLVSSRRMTLYSYGGIRLHTLLGTSGGSRRINGVRYHYDWKAKTVQQVSTIRIRKQHSGSCRWVDFTAALTDGGTGKIALSQKGADPQEIDVAGGGPITVPAKWNLTGHAFKWTFHIEADPGATAFIAGKASCWSRDGKTH